MLLKVILLLLVAVRCQTEFRDYISPYDAKACGISCFICALLLDVAVNQNDFPVLHLYPLVPFEERMWLNCSVH